MADRNDERGVDRDILDTAMDDVLDGASPDDTARNMGEEADRTTSRAQVLFSQVKSFVKRVGQSAMGPDAANRMRATYDVAAERVDEFRKSRPVRHRVEGIARDYSSLDYMGRTLELGKSALTGGLSSIFMHPGIVSTLAGVATIGIGAGRFTGRMALSAVSGLYRGVLGLQDGIGDFRREAAERAQAHDDAFEKLVDEYCESVRADMVGRGVDFEDLQVLPVEYAAGLAGQPPRYQAVDDFFEMFAPYGIPRKTPDDLAERLYGKSPTGSYPPMLTTARRFADVVEQRLAAEHGLDRDNLAALGIDNVEVWRGGIERVIREDLGDAYGTGKTPFEVAREQTEEIAAENERVRVGVQSSSEPSVDEQAVMGGMSGATEAVKVSDKDVTDASAPTGDESKMDYGDDELPL